MRQQDSNVVPFPTRPARAMRPVDSSGADAVGNAARAGAAAAEAVADILGAHMQASVEGDSLALSKAANAGVLWGAVLGIARRHGQIPALAALEHVVERLRKDPQGLITEPQHQPVEDGTARAVRALLA